MTRGLNFTYLKDPPSVDDREVKNMQVIYL